MTTCLIMNAAVPVVTHASNWIEKTVTITIIEKSRELLYLNECGAGDGIGLDRIPVAAPHSSRVAEVLPYTNVLEGLL